jgi:hypothetical protein
MQTENGAPRGKFGPKRDEVTGDWRKLHSEKLYNFHNFPVILRMIRKICMIQEGHVACMGR